MIPETLLQIGNNLRTQDNRCTDQPLWVVFKKRRIYGIDSDYCDDRAWIDAEGKEADEKEADILDRWAARGDVDESKWRRTGYIDIDVFVTACFTEQGCKDYIAANGHNLNQPHIYADGSYRNREYRAVRDFLMSLPAAEIG